MHAHAIVVNGPQGAQWILLALATLAPFVIALIAWADSFTGR